MQKLPTLLIQFYRPLLLWNLLFSCAGFAFVNIYGAAETVNSLFIKGIGYLSSVGFQYYFSANKFYYYRNAGYSLRKLYPLVFALDLIVYLLTVYLLIKLNWNAES